MKHIRKYYGVPAKRGRRIEYTGRAIPIRGVIVSADGQYLRIRLDGEKRARNFHPTWEMRYEDVQ